MSAPKINDASFRRMDSQSSFSLNPLFSCDSSLTFYGYGSTSTLSLGVRCRDACDEWTSGGDTRRPRDPASNTSFLSPLPPSFSAGSGRKKISEQLFGVGGWMGQRMRMLREERSLRCSISFHPPPRTKKAGVNQVKRLVCNGDGLIF